MIRTATALALIACLGLAACAAPRGGNAGEGKTLTLPALPPPGEPADLIVMNGAQIRAQFGAPAFIRKEGVNQLWRYDGRRCKAFFFFAESADGLAVRHVETVPSGAVMAADPACLSALRGRAPVS